MAIDDNLEPKPEPEPEELRSSVAICGFLELAIHQLLYVKNVYQRKTFERIMRNNIPTWICREPDVHQYVLDFLDFVHGFLVQQQPIRVVFVLKETSGVIIEQFFFEVKVNNHEVERQEQLLAIVDKLIPVCQNIDTEFAANPEQNSEDVTFELQVRIRPPTVLPRVNPDFPWVMYSKKPEDSSKVASLKKEENKLYEMKAYVHQKNEQDGVQKIKEINAIKVVQKPGQRGITVLQKTDEEGKPLEEKPLDEVLVELIEAEKAELQKAETA